MNSSSRNEASGAPVAPGDLDARLRRDADGARRDPSPELHGRILAAIHDAPLPADRSTTRRLPIGEWRFALAIAATLLVLVSAWAAMRAASSDGGAAPAPGSEPDVASLRELLELQPSTLLVSVEDPLLAEAQNLLSDANRAAEGLVRGIPAPLRGPFDREERR